MTNFHEIEIAFGKVFIPQTEGRPHIRRRDVITDVGNNTYFFVATFAIDEDIPTIPILSGGTGGPQNIYEFIG